MIKELVWLSLVFVVSFLIEMLLIEMLIIGLINLHPVVGVKIQGLIGLLIIAYIIRMFSRIRDFFNSDSDPTTNGRNILE